MVVNARGQVLRCLLTASASPSHPALCLTVQVRVMSVEDSEAPFWQLSECCGRKPAQLISELHVAELVEVCLPPMACVCPPSAHVCSAYGRVSISYVCVRENQKRA